MTLENSYKQSDFKAPKGPCDVVMKGGITSGVVYPLAICELAKEFRLHNIGGTSAGAVAAAVAAAAEFGRDSQDGGFPVLAKVPEKMSRDLMSLFQPSTEMRPLFEMLIAAQKGKSKPGKLGRAVVTGVSNYPVATGAGVLAGVWLPHIALAMGVKLGAGLLLPLLGGGGGLSARLLRAIRKELPANGFGMCTGKTQPGYRKPALTNWLADTIDRAAGRDVNDKTEPLTFGELKEADINLQMMTTNLSMRRPYRLPLETGIYVFRRRDFARLFPKRVLDYIMKTVRPYPGYKPYLMAGKSKADKKSAVIIEGVKGLPSGEPLRFRIFDDQKNMIVDKEEAELVDVDEELAALKAKLKQLWDKRNDLNEFEKHQLVQSVTSMLGHTPKNGPQLEDYYYFPDKKHLPVVVAARMSLSFPGLISAVPLYARDFTLKGEEMHKLRLCWFSDGGVSSNFPIHLFDQLWPNSPTFGIALEPYDKRRHGARKASTKDSDQSGLVEMPVEPPSGIPLPIYPIEGLGSFVMTILNSAKDWQDNMQSTLPGYRERIVHLALKKEEGGLNLNMPPETVQRLSDRGEEAGRVACEHFAPSDAPDKKFDLNDHRWRRYLIGMANVEQVLADLRDAWDPQNVESLCELLESYSNETAEPKSYKGNNKAWLCETEKRTQELVDLVEKWRQRENGAAEDGEQPPRHVRSGKIPRPKTDLRIVPRDVT